MPGCRLAHPPAVCEVGQHQGCAHIKVWRLGVMGRLSREKDFDVYFDCLQVRFRTLS